MNSALTTSLWAPRPTIPGAGSDRGARSWLLVILVLGAVARLAWWLAFDRVIELNGADYARLAENIFAGEGFVAMFGGPHVLYPPLYSLLMGLVAELTSDVELAGRLVSFFSGLATIVLLAAIVDRLAGRQAALIAAALTALHPLPVAFSVSVHTEPLWMALISAAILAAMLAVERPTAARGAGIGILSGLAYLTRPEGLVYALVLSALPAVASLRGRAHVGPSIRFGLIAGITFLVVAAPYMLFLSLQAGEFRWEGKSGANNIISARMRDGMRYAEASRGLSPEGEPVGVYLLKDQRVFLRQHHAGTAALVTTLLANPRERLAVLARRFVYADFLGRPLLLFAGLGVALAGWWRARPKEGALLLAVVALQVAMLASLEFTWSRYLVSFLPALIVWAAVGVDTCVFLLQSATRFRSTALPGILAVGLTGLVCIAAARGTYHLEEIGQARMVEVKVAGEVMAADFRRRGRHGGRPVVVGSSSPFAFYAGANYLKLPYADERLALRYLHREHPDYIALRSLERNEAPYGATWLDDRIGDPCAEVLWEDRFRGQEQVRVWRWTCDQ